MFVVPAPPQSDRVVHSDRSSRFVATLLLALAGLAQLADGVAAIGGNAALKANVDHIEQTPQFGPLYLGLGTWGVVLALVGLAELVAAFYLGRSTRQGRALGLAATLVGLCAGFFTLAIFRLVGIGCVLALMTVLYLLSYRVRQPR